MHPLFRDPAYNRYLKRFIPASVIYAGAIVLASMLIPDHAKASPLTIGIALLPGLACTAMIWAMARLLVEMEDEYLRLIEIKKALIATGFALGVAAHGIGTSRAFSVHPEAGAYASLGMGLHGIVGAVVIPYAVAWWF